MHFPGQKRNINTKAFEVREIFQTGKEELRKNRWLHWDPLGHLTGPISLMLRWRFEVECNAVEYYGFFFMKFKIFSIFRKNDIFLNFYTFSLEMIKISIVLYQSALQTFITRVMSLTKGEKLHFFEPQEAPWCRKLDKLRLFLEKWSVLCDIWAIVSIQTSFWWFLPIFQY